MPIEENIQKLGEHLDADELPTAELHWFKRAIEDAKVYYVEALTAQPGNYNQAQVYKTLWFETELGAALKTFYEAFRKHPTLHAFARIVLPRDAVGGVSGENTTRTDSRHDPGRPNRADVPR